MRYIRCKLVENKSYDQREKTLQNCTQRGKKLYNYEVDGYFQNLDIGANLLVEINEQDFITRILSVLSINDDFENETMSVQNEWEDYTHLDAITMHQNSTAVSISQCNEGHPECRIMGIHVIDVASFISSTRLLRLISNLRARNNQDDIHEEIQKQTGGNMALKGFKKNKLQPCISIFVHSFMSCNAEITPKSTMIRIAYRYLNEMITRQIAENHRGYEHWDFLFEMGWKYRLHWNSEPMYAFFDTWICDFIEDYQSSLTVQMFTRIISTSLSDFLQRRTIAFPAVKICVNKEADAELYFPQYAMFSSSLRCFYEYKAAAQIDTSQIRSPVTEIIVFQDIWKRLVKAAKEQDTLMCSMMLGSYHIHPFLVEATHQLHMNYENIVMEGPDAINNVCFEKIICNVTRPIKQLESIWIEKLVIHAIQHGRNTDEISHMSGNINNKLPQEKYPPISVHNGNTEDVLAIQCKVGVYTDMSGKTATNFIKRGFRIKPSNLDCYAINQKQWEKIQKILWDNESQLPFDKRNKNPLFNAILSADATKVCKANYTINEHHQLQENIYLNKPVIMQKSITHAADANDNIINTEELDILTLSAEVHKCLIHEQRFVEAFPGGEEPLGWKMMCSNQQIFLGVKLKRYKENIYHVLNNENLPTRQQSRYVCVTRWVPDGRQRGDKDSFVFYAHAENIANDSKDERLIQVLSQCQHGFIEMASNKYTLQYI